jgi:hypothetical protein
MHIYPPPPSFKKVNISQPDGASETCSCLALKVNSPVTQESCVFIYTE